MDEPSGETKARVEEIDKLDISIFYDRATTLLNRINSL